MNTSPDMVGASVNAMSINITTTIRGVNSLPSRLSAPRAPSSVTATPPHIIDEYMASTSASARSEVMTPTSSTAAGPTTSGMRCPQRICMIVVMPVTANIFCEKNIFSASLPVATNVLVATTATANTNHCSAYAGICPTGGRSSRPYFRFISCRICVRGSNAAT